MTTLAIADIIDLAVVVTLGLTTIGGLAACIRLIAGPSLADRVVSLDLVTTLLIAVAALLAIKTDEAVYLDLALALALVGFLATVAFARYAERRPQGRHDKSEFRPTSSLSAASTEPKPVQPHD